MAEADLTGGGVGPVHLGKGARAGGNLSSSLLRRLPELGGDLVRHPSGGLRVLGGLCAVPLFITLVGPGGVRPVHC